MVDTNAAEVPSFPLGEHLGLAVEPGAPGHARAIVDVTPKLLNPHGVLHGGVVCAMIDTAMGVAARGVIPAGRSPVTVELHVRFLRAVAEGRVTVEASVLDAGADVAQFEATARDAGGRDIASASATFAIVGARTGPTGGDVMRSEP